MNLTCHGNRVLRIQDGTAHCHTDAQFCKRIYIVWSQTSDGYHRQRDFILPHLLNNLAITFYTQHRREFLLGSSIAERTTTDIVSPLFMQTTNIIKSIGCASDNEFITQELTGLYNVQSIPTFFLIDRTNTLQARDAQIKDIEAAIKNLL